MKYLIVSDIHGSKYYMDKVFAEFEKKNCDKMIILGDILYHGPRNRIPEGYNPAELAEDINNFDKEIIAIRGNCDAEVDQMVIDVDIMNSDRVVDLNGMKVFLTHGHHVNEENMPDEEIDILMNGHTHVPVLKNKNEVIFLNPGSITMPKQETPHSYAVMDEVSISVFDIDTGEIFLEMSI